MGILLLYLKSSTLGAWCPVSVRLLSGAFLQNYSQVSELKVLLYHPASSSAPPLVSALGVFLYQKTGFKPVVIFIIILLLFIYLRFQKNTLNFPSSNN